MSNPEPIDLARAADFTLGAIAVRPSTLEVIVGDRREVFEPRIMQVFVALALRRGEVVSRDDLTRDCWGGRVVGEDSINRCIARIRRLAEAEGGFALETIPRVGYRLVEIATAVEAQPPAAPRWYLDRRWQAAAAAVLVLLVAGGFAAWLLRPLTATLTVTAPQVDRVAVLPFDTLSARQDVRFFGDGVAEQIIGVLNDNQVQAVSRDKSAALRGAARDRAARQLGAEFIMDGTVQQTAAGLRVTVHLDHAPTHTTLWTASFDQAGHDPLELQAQIAARAVDATKAALRARAGGIDDVALAAYLQALENARLGGTGATMMRRDLMRKVVARAPDFSLGHSGLAVSSAQLLQFAPRDEAPALRQEARKAADRALALDPGNGEAYYALALLVPSVNLSEREALFRKGLAVEPDEPSLNSSLAALLADEGRLKQAVVLQRRAVMLDPLSPRKTAGLAEFLASAGQIGEARATIDRAIKLWPTNPGVWMTRLYILASFGFDAEAKAMVDAPQTVPVGLEPEFRNGVRAYLDAIATGTPAARTNVKRITLAAVASEKIQATMAVEIFAHIGELDEAFALAGRALAPAGGPKSGTEILFHPATAKMRGDPRFRDLMERTGLFAYWSRQNDAPDFCATEDVPICQDLKRS